MSRPDTQRPRSECVDAGWRGRSSAWSDGRRAADSVGCDYPAPDRIRSSTTVATLSRGAVGAAARARAVAREAVVSAVAAPVTSVVAITIVAVLCAVVVLTTGRSVGAQTAIVAGIDSESTRAIVVQAPESSGLDTSVLGRLANANQVAAVTAFGPADDVHNSHVDGGSRVALRTEYTLGAEATAGVAPASTTAPRALASPTAARLLGLADGVGSVASVASRAEYSVAGVQQLPDELRLLDPMVVVPATAEPGHPRPVSVLVVVAASSAQVTAVTALVESVLSVADPAKVTVTTSAQLAALGAAVQSQLGEFSRSLTLLVFGVGSVLVAAVVYALVLLRRKDFGRRRALGASRLLIVALLLTQVTLLGALGAVAGCTAADLVLTLTGDPLPAANFTLAVAVLAALTAVLASVVPAVIASTRDPLRELRVA